MNINRVLVLGDIMLDRYLIGDTTRISPEAPIPIILQKEVSESIGGAANLCHNLINLGLSVDLVGGIGEDTDGKILKNLCSKIGINCYFEKTIGPTISKTRVLSRNQQMIRIDNEGQSYEYRVLDDLPNGVDLNTYKLVIISDYGKGFCNNTLITKLIKNCSRINLPVYVDPKGKDWSKYKGANLIKPNVAELEEFLSFKPLFDTLSIKEYYQRVSTLNIAAMVLSRAKDGLTLISQEFFYHCEAPPIDVFDVSGAGDTVMAVLAYGYINKIPLEKTVQLSTLCGTYVVSKSKTYAISLEEVKKIIVESNLQGIHC